MPGFSLIPNAARFFHPTPRNPDPSSSVLRSSARAKVGFVLFPIFQYSNIPLFHPSSAFISQHSTIPSRLPFTSIQPSLRSGHPVTGRLLSGSGHRVSRAAGCIGMTGISSRKIPSSIILPPVYRQHKIHFGPHSESQFLPLPPPRMGTRKSFILTVLTPESK